MNKNTSGRFANVQFLAGKTAMTVRQLTIVTIWAMMIALLFSCGGTPASVTSPPVTEPSQSTEPSVTQPPTTPPLCTPTDKKFTCEGRLDHEITLSDVPEGFTPNLLPITDEQEQKLRDAEKDGTGCIFVIVGDLAFYDKDKILVPNPNFPSKVTITYTFTAQDLQEFEKCKNTLIQNKTVAADAHVDYVPVYFFKDKWKPFDDKDYDIDANGMVTIRFTSWGDSPFGGGSKP